MVSRANLLAFAGKLSTKRRAIAIGGGVILLVLAAGFLFSLKTRPAVAEFSFQALSETDGEQAIKLFLDSASHPVGFVKTEINFNPGTVMVYKVEPAGALKNMIAVTPVAQINAEGKVEIVLGLAVEDKNSPPTGKFEVATVYVRKQKETGNGETKLTVNTNNSQVVGMGAKEMEVKAQPIVF